MDRHDLANALRRSRAGVNGAFFGQDAAQLGFGYTVSNPKYDGETDTIQGVAVMDRSAP